MCTRSYKPELPSWWCFKKGGIDLLFVYYILFVYPEKIVQATFLVELRELVREEDHDEYDYRYLLYVSAIFPCCINCISIYYICIAIYMMIALKQFNICDRFNIYLYFF